MSYNNAELSIDDNIVKSFDILPTTLNVIYNYFDV